MTMTVRRQGKRFLFAAGALAAALPMAVRLRRTAARSAVKGETVILLHGMLSHSLFMHPVERVLVRAGYRTVNWGYPSARRHIEEHARALDAVVRRLDTPGRVHFVGFCMGAIIARYYLAHYPLPRAGRLVMIAPPNHGAELIDRLYRYPWFRWAFGAKGIAELRTDNSAFRRACGVPRKIEIGIIAGGKGDGRGFRRTIPGDDDGTVSVESTRLEGAKDFIQVRSPHAMLPFKRETADNALRFLRTGRFHHPAGNRPPAGGAD